MFKCSVWNSGMFNDKENELRETMFSQLVSNISGAIIVEEHMDYLKVKGNDSVKTKIEKIISETFEGNGWITHEK